MEPKIHHTPAPWKYSPKLSPSENHRGYYIYSEGGMTICNDVYPLNPDGDEGESNACLISATPDLFGTVKYLHGFLNRLKSSDLPKECRHAFRQSKALIDSSLKKAETKLI